MASNLLKINLQIIHTPNHSFHQTRTPSLSLPFPSTNYHLPHSHLSFFPSAPFHRTKPLSLSIHSSLSSPTPPTSKKEAILQAKTCISTALEKPLTNLQFSKRFKKLRQPRFQVEIPAVDDSPAALSQLALQVFGEIPIRRKGPPVKIVILWPSSILTEAAIEAFKSNSSNSVEHLVISSVATNGRLLNSAEVAVFLAPEASQLADIKRVTDSFYPRPVVIFNPGWEFEEGNFGDLGGFLASFEVVYSFMGLEVAGFLSSRKGVVIKCAKNGGLSGQKWVIFVEEGGGELKPVSSFKARPSINEVENVLYNVMAVNSPITKSVKFLKGLVSNVTGRK